MSRIFEVTIIPEFFFIIVLIFLVFFFLLVAQSKLYYYPLVLKTFIYVASFFLFFLVMLYYNSLNLYTGLFTSNFNVSLDLSLLKIVIIVFSIFSILLSLDFLKAEKINDFEYIVLILFSIFGIVVLVSANDLLIMYVSIEIQSLSLYILVSIKKNTLYSTEAGLKYFVLGSLASILLLFGFSGIYGIFGSINFSDLALILSFDSDITSILLFPTLYVLVGLLFKLTIVPFHFWAVDVYEGSPSSITLYMLVVPKLSFLIVFIHFFLIVYNSLYTIISPFLVFFSVLSMVVGSLLSLKQKKFKRLFIYSSITHMGFLFLSLSLLTLGSFNSFFLYFFLYILMSLCIWGIFLSLRLKFNNSLVLNLINFNSLMVINPFLTIIFSLMLLAMAGIPPLPGFWSKFLIFNSIIDSNFYYLSVFIILLSSFSVFYYLVIVKNFYFIGNKSSFRYLTFNRIGKLNSIVILILFLITNFFLVYPNFFLVFSNIFVYLFFF